MNNNLKNITKMYDKLTYFDQYGGSLILFIIITLIIIILISYFHTMINIQPIINDWSNQRCKPTIIPFAGLINHPEGVSATDYTFQNFTYCTQNILSNITGYAVEPLTFITNILQNISNNVKNDIQSIRGMFNKIRTYFQDVSQEIMGRLMNVMIPLQQIIINFRDIIGKIQGSMTVGLFTLLGSYYTLKALMGAIAQFIITILIALAVMIAVFWAAPFTWGVAISNTVIFIAIAIPMAIILAFMVDVLKVQPGGFNIPSVKCFDKNTFIHMHNGTYKKIIDICVGDILFNNNIVTAKIKVTSDGSQMYILDNIIVSDTHIVKYKDKWIPVSCHPNAVKYNSYNDAFLYCLNTSQKIIKINNTLFTDWDELYENKLNKVINNLIIPIVDINYIHKYLDIGFSKNTKIRLFNNIVKNIHKIKIGDILENGDKVYGLVEINGFDIIEQYKYNLGNNTFIEGYNPHLICNKQKLQNKHKTLYHLLTEKKTFKIDNITFFDYNSAIDIFLEK